MKPKLTLPLAALTILAALSPFSPAQADTYKSYSFDVPSFAMPPLISIAIPVGLTDAAINASFGVSLTNDASSGTYSISPVDSTFIQRIYLGVQGDLLETELTGADLGTALSTVGPPNSDSEYSTITDFTLPDLSNYTEITIDTNFTLDADVASGSGSIDLYAVPEPSTWSLLLGGAGMLAFVAIRRSRGRQA